MEVPSLVELLKSGVHFGHQKSKWHPNMKPFIFGTKQNIHIVNLEDTQRMLEVAAKAAQDMAAHGKQILFVGTKHQASAIIEKYANECGMPYVNMRWLGGLLTNFRNVSQVPRKLTKLKDQREKGELKKYTKKEQLEFDREIEKLQGLVGGLEILMKMPDALFIVDLKEEKTALREANQMNVPVFALCDTNVDPKKVQWPIPGNDDAVKSLDLIVRVMSQAIDEGRKHPIVDAPKAEAPKAEAPKAQAKAVEQK